MQKTETNFEGLYLIQSKVFIDIRGCFIKTYNHSLFCQMGLDADVKERYFSVSNKNVIRGMHFQIPPHDHIKMVNVINGAIMDVILDLRAKSRTYGRYFNIKLKAEEGKILYIPKGFAHGFLALEDNTIVEYNQTTEYAPKYDSGIFYNSFGYNWNIKNPILSERDKSFPIFHYFKTMF